VIVLLHDRVNAIGIDRDAVSNAQDVRDGFRSEIVGPVTLEDSFFQIRWIFCIGIASWSLQCWNLASFPVFFGELLNLSAANLELIGNELRVHAMINNSLTYPGDIVLIEFHFTWSVIREIVLTKSLAYTTDGYEQALSYVSSSGKVDRVRIHQLLACLSHEPVEVFSPEKEIHHRNTVRWDNREENLEVVSRKEHQRAHREGEWVEENGFPVLAVQQVKEAPRWGPGTRSDKEESIYAEDDPWGPGVPASLEEVRISE